MIKFKLFKHFNTKKKIALIGLLIIALPFILDHYHRSVIKAYLYEQPSIRIHLINIAKVAIPLRNLILLRSVDDKIALIKSSGSCPFCDLSNGNFKGADLKGVDLRYANLSNSNLSNVNLNGANLRKSNLMGANLDGVNLINMDLTESNLSGVDLSNRDLTGINLSGVDLSNKDLTGANLNQSNLSEANLRNVNLTGANLIFSNLTGVNLDGVDLSQKDLTGVILSGVDLSNRDLTGTILTFANLTGANLDGVDLSQKDLTGINLTGVDLSNTDLTGAILTDTKKIEIRINNPSNSNWPALDEIQNLNVTRYDLSGDVQYLATKEGLLFESKNNESRLVLDLNKDALFPFTDYGYNGGFLGVVSNKEFVYISYTSKGPDFDNYVEDKNYAIKDSFSSLIVDEYSSDFKNVRNLIKIDGFEPTHYGGALLFDQQGRLYLSTGTGYNHEPNDSPAPNIAQNLKDLRGKILRLDVSKLKQDPEIVAYGIRNPFGVTIDSKNRMFVAQCGRGEAEALYLLNDLYSGVPVNFGWPVFEGSIRMIKDPLMFKDVSAPIFEYNTRPGCMTSGLYLDDIESFLFADYFGTIGLLKQQENGKWYLIHEYKQEKNINGFGLDKKAKKIFIAPNNLELEILVEQVKLD